MKEEEEEEAKDCLMVETFDIFLQSEETVEEMLGNYNKIRVDHRTGKKKKEIHFRFESLAFPPACDTTEKVRDCADLIIDTEKQIGDQTKLIFHFHDNIRVADLYLSYLVHKSLPDSVDFCFKRSYVILFCLEELNIHSTKILASFCESIGKKINPDDFYLRLDIIPRRGIKIDPRLFKRLEPFANRIEIMISLETLFTDFKETYRWLFKNFVIYKKIFVLQIGSGLYA